MMRSSIKVVLTCVLLSFFNYISGQEVKLVAGHVLYRHGDRTPLNTFPSDPVKQSDWPNGFGQLTTLGIEQQHHLGLFIRNHYDSLLSANYTPSEITVRSTDFDRTLMSAQSNLVGLYPVLDPTPDRVPMQPIPIHTVLTNLDFLLGQNDCPRYDQIEEQILQSSDVQNMNQYYASFFRKLEQWTNLTNITLYDAWDVADTILVEEIYNKTPSWALDPGVRQNLSNINDRAFQYLFANNETQRIRGGPPIQDIWFNMNNTVNGSSHKKVKIYSAHDTTLSAVLSFLGINYPHQPKYASALFVDLYRTNVSYFVRVEYLNETGSNETYPYQLLGCLSVNCSFENFTAIYKPRFPAGVDVECQRQVPPNPSPADDPEKLTIALAITITSLVLIIFSLFFFLYIRQTRPEPVLLADDESAMCA